MAKKLTPVPPVFWLVLELDEYFTLRNQGLLHSLPASRYVALDGTYRDWYPALSPGWQNGRYFVVQAMRPADSNQPLAFQDVIGSAFYTLQPKEQAVTEFLYNRLGPKLLSSAPFDRIIAQVAYAQWHYRFGLVFITLSDYEALKKGSLQTISASAYMPVDVCLDIAAWKSQLPDFEEENKVLVAKVKIPVSINTELDASALDLDLVYPLNAQGRRMIEIQNPAIRTDLPAFEITFVGPVLRDRLLAERRYNAGTLAAYAGAKPTKEVGDTCAELEKAWEMRQKRVVTASPNTECKSFWDYLIDYDRTGNQTLGIGNNDRGYLQDLTIVIGRYIKRSLVSQGLMQTEEFNQVLYAWQELAGDSELDNNAYKVFSNPSKRQALTIEKVLVALNTPGPNPLATGFIFLRLRREIADLEQELGPQKLKDYVRIAGKNKAAMHIALYALGLTFPFKSFVELYESSLFQPTSEIKHKVAKSNTDLFAHLGSESEPVVKPFDSLEGPVSSGTAVGFDSLASSD